MEIKYVFTNFRLKEHMDWNSLLVKVNCYKREWWHHSLNTYCIIVAHEQKWTS